MTVPRGHRRMVVATVTATAAASVAVAACSGPGDVEPATPTTVVTQTETQTETATETVEPSPAPDDETASPDAEAWTMLTAVRAGQHEGFDRIVIDVDGPDVPPWETEYVEEVLDPKGESWTVRGEALLRILVHAPARDTDWNPTVPPAQEAVDVAGFESLRQVAFVGEHHGTATFAVGVDEARPVTTDMVSDGTHHRLVVDVPHA